MGEMTDREHTELVLLYNSASEEIDRTKREQRFHYAASLVAMAGVSVISLLAFGAPDAESAHVVATALGGLLVLGLSLLGMHQVRLHRLQRFMGRCAESLEPHTRAILMTWQGGSVYRLMVPVLLGLAMVLVFGFLAIVALPQGEEEQAVPSASAMES